VYLFVPAKLNGCTDPMREDRCSLPDKRPHISAFERCFIDLYLSAPAPPYSFAEYFDGQYSGTI
jgi:hypothetical protein